MGNPASLITGKKPTFTTTKKDIRCAYCSRKLPRGAKCAEILQSGSFSNKKTYCLGCLKEIIGQTRFDLNLLEKRLTNFTSKE